jgi:hypothetical protein
MNVLAYQKIGLLPLPPERIVGWFTGRWSIEVTFQEVRQHLGFTTPRNWCAKSVLRTAPCLLGLFSLVALIFHRLWQRKRIAPRSVVCHERSDFQRRACRSTAFVLERGFEKAVAPCGCDKTPASLTPHAAGSALPGRVRTYKTAKST